MDLSLSGLASGFDWKSVVDQLVEIERAPQRRARREQYDVSRRNQLLGNIKDELSSVESKAMALLSTEDSSSLMLPSNWFRRETSYCSRRARRCGARSISTN